MRQPPPLRVIKTDTPLFFDRSSSLAEAENTDFVVTVDDDVPPRNPIKNVAATLRKTQEILQLQTFRLLLDVGRLAAQLDA